MRLPRPPPPPRLDRQRGPEEDEQARDVDQGAVQQPGSTRVTLARTPGLDVRGLREAPNANG